MPDLVSCGCGKTYDADLHSSKCPDHRLLPKTAAGKPVAESKPAEPELPPPEPPLETPPELPPVE